MQIKRHSVGHILGITVAPFFFQCPSLGSIGGVSIVQGLRLLPNGSWAAVHQVSAAEKASVPEEVRAKARAMGKAQGRLCSGY